MSNYEDLDIPCYEELEYVNVNNPFTEEECYFNRIEHVISPEEVILIKRSIKAYLDSFKKYKDYRKALENDNTLENLPYCGEYSGDFSFYDPKKPFLSFSLGLYSKPQRVQSKDILSWLEGYGYEPKVFWNRISFIEEGSMSRLVSDYKRAFSLTIQIPLPEII